MYGVQNTVLGNQRKNCFSDGRSKTGNEISVCGVWGTMC